EKEHLQWQKTIQFLNKKVNFTAPDSTLIIKNPGTTAQVKFIRAIYPGARFIFLHRNPYDVFYSNIKLWKRLLDNLALQVISDEDIKENILYIYRKMHLNYLEDKKAIPAGHLVEIPYQELSSAPKECLSSIFRELGLPNFERKLPHFEKYLNQISHTESHYDYQSEDLTRINRDWKFMFENFNYSVRQTAVKNA
ncbi:MAG TPA: sulfotransferase, partial [Saprospiraceae bacterium]|nr:sulfotransferase [Saprospiraceae bacterium]